MLMLDEPSMGLSPLLVQEIFDIIRNIHKEGMTILLVEQNAQRVPVRLSLFQDTTRCGSRCTKQGAAAPVFRACTLLS